MKVKKLINELKKLPQNLNVGMAMHDNSEGEVADWVHSISCEREKLNDEEEEYGNEVVILHG